MKLHSKIIIVLFITKTELIYDKKFFLNLKYPINIDMVNIIMNPNIVKLFFTVLETDFWIIHRIYWNPAV